MCKRGVELLALKIRMRPNHYTPAFVEVILQSITGTNCSYLKTYFHRIYFNNNLKMYMPVSEPNICKQFLFSKFRAHFITITGENYYVRIHSKHTLGCSDFAVFVFLLIL